MRPVMGAKSLWTPRELALMVPVGAEEVTQPPLTKRPIVAVGELHEDEAEREAAAGATPAAAAAEAVEAEGAEETREAEEADAADEAVAAAGAASAAEALPAAGASGAAPDEEPTKGMEPQPPRPKATLIATITISAVERMWSIISTHTVDVSASAGEEERKNSQWAVGNGHLSMGNPPRRGSRWVAGAFPSSAVH